MKYTIVTEKHLYDCEVEELTQLQNAKLMELGFSLADTYRIHFFKSAFCDESEVELTISEAIECLAIKDGVNLVQYENGNYGFVAYYNGKEDTFEII